jgi:Zn-dependent M16 (insulinase) family peptidase
MIERFFLRNPHRATLVLKPDPDLAAKQEEAERRVLENARSSMSASELEATVENTRELRRLQEEPDSPDGLATIPVLDLSDLEKTNKAIPRAVSHRKGTTVLFHDIPTNGIAYLDVGFNLHSLPQEYLPFVPLFGRALVEMGTEREDFVTLSQRISRKTGGIRPELFASAVDGSQTSAAWLFLRGKSMLAQTREMIDILGDVLLTARLDNRERFRQMVLEEKARQEQKLVPGGNRVVNVRLRAHFSEADWAVEQMSGVSYLFFVRDLARRVDQDWQSVIEPLEAMRSILVNRGAMVLNATVEDASRPSLESRLEDFLEALPEAVPAVAQWRPVHPSPFEGMIIPSQVNFVGKGADLYGLGYRFHGSALVITGYLRNSWLWERVRVQGGAYGASCLFNRHSGILTFVSYRDPNLVETLEAYDQSAEFLRKTDLSEKELTKAIIGSIGNLDAPLLPDAKGFTSLVRYLTGATDEARQKMRDEILTTTVADFREFADVLARFNDAGLVKVLGSEPAIEEALGKRPGWLKTFKLL